MASLTKTSTLSRKSIRFAVYAIILFTILRYVVKAGINIYRYFFPAPPPRPTISFGTLPAIPFPEPKTTQEFTFILETPEGSLPELSSQLEVYFIPPIPSNIRSLELAKNKAQSLKFNPNGKPVIESVKNVYIFHKDNSPATLTMNIITGIFSISYNISANQQVISAVPPSPEATITKTRNYLQEAGYLTPDLIEAPTSHEFLRVESNRFVPVLSLSEANLTKINLFRTNLGAEKDITTVTPNFPEANIWFIYSGYAGGEIIAGEYHHFPLDLGKSSTYPLKTADLAWEELTGGKAFIANPGNNETGRITIRRIYLAYYDSGVYTEFYQPVVVFSGDNDFMAYVPAISPEYYNQPQN